MKNHSGCLTGRNLVVHIVLLGTGWMELCVSINLHSLENICRAV
jgi:hypothetical protein